MNPYVICTDSGCDLAPELLEEWGVPFCSLTFRFDGEDREYFNNDMDGKTFYDRMRKGGIAKTAAVNSQAFIQCFEKQLKEGKDLLYLGFSSGLSTTFNSARLAAEVLRESYPDRSILVVDTLAASAGQGLLVYLALQKQKEGASAEENAAYVEEMKWRLCHWFTVDDLVYLKRGGRISSASAMIGNMLAIKPVLHMDNEGHLVNVSKVRGRRNALSAIADQYGKLALEPQNGTVFISHADCLEEAELVGSMLRERYGAEVMLYTGVGPVIGAHSGPGTFALFFLGKER